jgi:hypothetical protein
MVSLILGSFRRSSTKTCQLCTPNLRPLFQYQKRELTGISTTVLAGNVQGRGLRSTANGLIGRHMGIGQNKLDQGYYLGSVFASPGATLR